MNTDGSFRRHAARWSRIALCAAGLGLAAACQAGQGGAAMIPTPSPKVAEFLGAGMVEVIAGADRVETFLLKPALAPDPKATGPDAIAGYFWKARGAALEPAAVQSLRAMVLDEASYDFVNAKKCPLVPEVALRFVKDSRNVDMLVSFSCALWQFEGAGAKRLEDFDPVRDQLKALVETVVKLD